MGAASCPPHAGEHEHLYDTRCGRLFFQVVKAWRNGNPDHPPPSLSELARFGPKWAVACLHDHIWAYAQKLRAILDNVVPELTSDEVKLLRDGKPSKLVALHGELSRMYQGNHIAARYDLGRLKRSYTKQLEGREAQHKTMWRKWPGDLIVEQVVNASREEGGGLRERLRGAAEAVGSSL